MGAWGVGNLENDAALDWVLALTDSAEPVQEVRNALSRIVDQEEVDATAAAVALAAAEVTAAARGFAAADFPESAFDLLDQHHEHLRDANMVELARHAIVAAKTSELSELWDDAGDEDWLEATRQLDGRLARPSSPFRKAKAKRHRLTLRIGDVFTIPIDQELGVPCRIPANERRVGVGQIVAAPDPQSMGTFWVVVFDRAYRQGEVPEPSVATGAKRLTRKLTMDALLYHGHWKIIGNAPVRRRLRPLSPGNIDRSYSPMHLENELKDRYGAGSR